MSVLGGLPAAGKVTAATSNMLISAKSQLKKLLVSLLLYLDFRCIYISARAHTDPLYENVVFFEPYGQIMLCNCIS